MRISDWSSDVCSSDLGSIDVACRLHRFDHRGVAALAEFGAGVGNLDEDDVAELPLREVGDADRRDVDIDVDPRTDERSVGQERVRKCRSRWLTDQQNKYNIK